MLTIRWCTPELPSLPVLDIVHIHYLSILRKDGHSVALCQIKGQAACSKSRTLMLAMLSAQNVPSARGLVYQ